MSKTWWAIPASALGNTTFTVVNPGAYDAVAPTFASGQVLTPTVSLSAIARGTANQAPFIGVRVVAADAGSTAVAGVAGEYELCELILWGQAGNVQVLASAACGGSTDFSTLFATTKITLTP